MSKYICKLANNCVTILHQNLILLKANVQRDRTTNKPTTDEIAVLMIDNGENFGNKRDVIIKQRNGTNEPILKFINETLHNYDPLAFPLMHIFGESGWQYNTYPHNPTPVLHNQKQFQPQHFSQIEVHQVDSDYINNEINIDVENKKGRYVTAREFYAFRLHDRPRKKNLKNIQNFRLYTESFKF
jgi:hypothetical protein